MIERSKKLNHTFWLEQMLNFRWHSGKVSKYGVFPGPNFSVFGMNTGIYGPEKSPYLYTFHAVAIIKTYVLFILHYQIIINCKKCYGTKKFSIKDFFSKRDRICSFLRIWSQLLKKSLIKNFIFRAVCIILGVLILFSIYVNVCTQKTRKWTCSGFCPVTPLTEFASSEILRRLKRAFT